MIYIKSKIYLFLTQTLIISYLLVFVYTLDQNISFDRFQEIFSNIALLEELNFLIFVSSLISIFLNSVRLIFKPFYKSNLFVNQFSDLSNDNRVAFLHWFSLLNIDRQIDFIHQGDLILDVPALKSRCDQERAMRLSCLVKKE